MLFGSSGIRRLYSKELLDISIAMGAAIGAQSQHIGVGRDTRKTGQVLFEGLISGILASGCDVHDGGIVPTPTVAIATRDLDVGCMITASHNPEPYNGFKLLNPDGSSFTHDQQFEMEQIIGESPRWNNWRDQGTFHPGQDFTRNHIESILSNCTLSKEISIVLDCGNGTGCNISPKLLYSLGVSVVGLNCNPNGIFARPSEPLPENVAYIPAIIRDREAAGGIVHDGDADRMMAFDERGRFISGDHLLMLFAEYTGARKVVTTVDASMAIEEVTEVRRTSVGDTFVSEYLRFWGDFGGEPSGSWIFPGHSLCPDGIYAAALFCEIAAEWDICDVVDAMPSYPVIRESMTCNDAPRILHVLGADVPTDGVRYGQEDGWCLIRASGTEPKIRVTAEGRTLKIAKEQLEFGWNLVKRAKNGDFMGEYR